MKIGDKVIYTGESELDQSSGKIYTVQSVYPSYVAVEESRWVLFKDEVKPASFKYYILCLQ